MKLKFTIIVFLLSSASLAHQCAYISVEEASEVYKNIFVGEVIDNDGELCSVTILKRWKGNLSLDSNLYLVQHGNYNKIGWLENNTVFVFYIDNKSVSICSRTKKYYNCGDIEFLDEKFYDNIKVNPSYKINLGRIKYEREFVVKTDSGDFDIKDKKVVFVNEKRLLFGIRKYSVLENSKFKKICSLVFSAKLFHTKGL